MTLIVCIKIKIKNSQVTGVCGIVLTCVPAQRHTAHHCLAVVQPHATHMCEKNSISSVWCMLLLQPVTIPSFFLHLHLSLNRRGRWDTTDDFTTSFLHFHHNTDNSVTGWQNGGAFQLRGSRINLSACNKTSKMSTTRVFVYTIIRTNVAVGKGSGNEHEVVGEVQLAGHNNTYIIIQVVWLVPVMCLSCVHQVC